MEQKIFDVLTQINISLKQLGLGYSPNAGVRSKGTTEKIASELEGINRHLGRIADSLNKLEK